MKLKKETRDKIIFLLLWIIIISGGITIAEAKELIRDYKKSEIIINNHFENKEQKSQSEGLKGNPGEVEASKEDAPDSGDSFKELSPEQEIRKVADELGFEEKDKLVKLAWCESRLKPECGELNNSKCINPKNNSFDRGYFQISRLWHSEVSDECAFNVTCATQQTIRILRERGWQEWSASESCWGNK